LKPVCRSIKPLRPPFAAATEQDAHAAALQFVRKISGYTKPSRANEEAFAKAVDEIAASSMRLLERLVVRAAPREVAPAEEGAIRPGYRE
jgi:hypothetical protein